MIVDGRFWCVLPWPWTFLAPPLLLLLLYPPLDLLFPKVQAELVLLLVPRHDGRADALAIDSWPHRLRLVVVVAVVRGHAVSDAWHDHRIGWWKERRTR